VTEQYLQSSINLLPAPSTFYAGIGASSVAIPGAGVTPLPLQVVEERGVFFEHSLGSSEVTFTASGIALIEWGVSINLVTGGRKNSQTALYLDAGSGFLPVNLSFGYGYHRNSSQGRDTTCGQGGLAGIRPGDKIEIASQRIAVTGNLQFIASSCSVLIGFIPEN